MVQADERGEDMIAVMYDRFFQEVLRYVLSLSKDRYLSEDITQDTFMRAMRCADIFLDMEMPACRAWLYKTARNLFIDRMRRRKKELEAAAEPTTYEDDLSRVMVNEAIAKLPEPEQALFRLRYMDGYNATQLGEMFDMPAATVRTRLSRARGIIRGEYLADNGKDD
jgi:RNA polymerase sigma-70 factor (ECF subfamily)